LVDHLLDLSVDQWILFEKNSFFASNICSAFNPLPHVTSRSWRDNVVQTVGLIVLALVGVFLFHMVINLRVALFIAPQPQAILTLGGGIEREALTARLAIAYPDLPVWVSTGTSLGPDIFAEYNVNPDRVTFDNRATDTVTNFTTTLRSLQQRQIRHVFLVTSDFHMARARAIAAVVFGFHGIAITPVEVPTGKMNEPAGLVLRDGLRSCLWLVTGWSGRLDYTSPLSGR